MIMKCLSLLFILSFINTVFGFTYARGSCSLPKLAHGTLRMRQSSRLVKFSCFPHYTLVGERYASCRRGKWDIPFPICVRNGCPELPKVLNAIHLSSHNNAWVVFFCFPGYQLIGSSSLYCDGQQWNSTVPACVVTRTAPALSCNFEAEDICGWKQDDIQDFVWTRLNKKTPSYFMFTGPSHDHTYGKGGEGYYMYIETSSRLENDTARLLSPIYDTNVAVNACFSFFYHMYGKNTGGLRVYQKPDKLSLTSMLGLSGSEMEKYLLFEQWGNQGEYWYSAVSDLANLSDDFQIVIEGIRGSSFTGDIAIDDVAILHGEDCAVAKAVATTPYPDAATTCEGRCDKPGERGCSCQSKCLKNNNCCPDFIELCIFTPYNTDSDDQLSSNMTVSPPLTERLIASTTEQYIRPNTTTIPPTTSTSTSTTTTTSSTTSTTVKTTTPRLVPKMQPLTTLRTTKVNPTVKTTPTIASTTKRIATTKAPTSTSSATKTTASPKIHQQAIDKKRKEEEIETRKLTTADESQRSNSHTALTATLILVLVTICACAVLSIQWARGSRGRATIARLRGRVTRDPEVRYLNADVDD